MILFFRASLRSLWSPVVVLIGLIFGLVGVGIVADARIGSRIDIASIVIGLGVTGLGLGGAWGGVRMGVVRTAAGLTVREVLGGSIYETDMLEGISVGEQDHDSLPLRIVFPVLRLVGGDDVPVMCLATYGILPSSRKRAAKAAARMAAWTGKPVLT